MIHTFVFNYDNLETGGYLIQLLQVKFTNVGIIIEFELMKFYKMDPMLLGCNNWGEGRLGRGNGGWRTVNKPLILPSYFQARPILYSLKKTAHLKLYVSNLFYRDWRFVLALRINPFSYFWSVWLTYWAPHKKGRFGPKLYRLVEFSWKITRVLTIGTKTVISRGSLLHLPLGARAK